MLKTVKMLLGFCCAAAVSACTFTDDIAGQVDRLNRSLEQSQEEALLLNIVRTSQGAPMGFTQVSSIIGTGNISTTLGLPYYSFGPGFLSPAMGSKEGFFNNTATASSGNNFTMSNLESKEFWVGMLTPLSADTLGFFIRQGIPREILFYLYFQRQERTYGKEIRILLNNPESESFQRYILHMALYLKLGLTTEAAVQPTDVGPPLSAAKAADPKQIVELAKAGLILRPVKTKGSTEYQITKVDTKSVICFDPALATLNINEFIPPEYTCSAMVAGQIAAALGGGGTLSISEKKHGPNNESPTYKLYPRSTYDVIRYLGSLVAAETRGNTQAEVELFTEEAKLGIQDPIGAKLFVVEKNSHRSDNFLSVTYNGDTYSIPAKATTTIRVLALVRQLIALSTSVNALPSTGTVLAVH